MGQGSVYIFYVLHSMIKSYVKNVNYLGKPSPNFQELLSSVFTKPVVILFVALFAAVVWLYILDKGKLKLSLVLLGIAVLAACSERIVTERGNKKEVTFQFERFRKY